MSYSPLALLHERQCAGVYTALDSGRPASAVKQCNELLTHQPNLHLAAALKAIGLCRTGEKAEAGKVVDKLVQLKGDDITSSILPPLTMALSLLERDADEAEVLEVACKAQPGSIELASQACMAMARTKQWQRMQQTALRLHKTAQRRQSLSKEKGASPPTDLYFWWSMQAYCLLADDHKASGAQLALPLAVRMIAKQLEVHPLGAQSEEILFLYARILQKQGKTAWPDALRLLSDNETGKALCARSMTLAALRHDLQQSTADWQAIYTEATQAMEAGNRNWAVVEAAVKSAIALAEANGKPSSIKMLEEKMMKAAREHKRDRTTRLSPMYLMSQVAKSTELLSAMTVNLLKLLTAYIDDFGGKACVYEDLQPILCLASLQEKQALNQKLATLGRAPPSPFTTLDSLYKVMNAVKLARAMQTKDDLGIESELSAALAYAKLYQLALPIGADLPKTEMQPGDDFALLSVQSLVHASAQQRANGQTGWQASLHLACALLHVALIHSPKGYRLRILLIRILFQFGAVDAARTQYDALGIKGVQYDTLGYLLAGRMAHTTLLLPPGSEAERSLLSSARRMRSVWQEARTQVPAMVCKALEHGTFSRVEEMMDFGACLDHSIVRRLHAIELARLHALGVSVGVSAEQLGAELSETCAALAESSLHDQRDRTVLSNFLPSDVDDIATMTAITALGEPDEAYLRATSDVAVTTLGVTASVTTNNKLEAGHLDKLPAEIRTIHDLISNKERDLVARVQAALQSLAQACNVTEPNQLPCAWLLSACAALETFAALSKKHGDIAGALDAARSGLREVRFSLLRKDQAVAGAVATTLDGEWSTLLEQLNGGKVDGSALVQVQSGVLREGTGMAVHSLVARIDDVLR